jgi:hypothetical protein
MNKDKRLTSVRVEDELFSKFRQECIRHRFSFQKLADRAMYLYLTNEEFKKQIHTQTDISIK